MGADSNSTSVVHVETSVSWSSKGWLETWHRFRSH